MLSTLRLPAMHGKRERQRGKTWRQHQPRASNTPRPNEDSTLFQVEYSASATWEYHFYGRVTARLEKACGLRSGTGNTGYVHSTCERNYWMSMFGEPSWRRGGIISGLSFSNHKIEQDTISVSLHQDLQN